MYIEIESCFSKSPKEKTIIKNVQKILFFFFLVEIERQLNLDNYICSRS